MPRPKTENTMQVALRIPPAFAKHAEALAKTMSTPGIPLSRTDVLRAAIYEGLERLQRKVGVR